MSDTEKKEIASEETEKKPAAKTKKTAAKKTAAKKPAAKKTSAKKKKTVPEIQNLLIVESPSKAKTIKKYLGSSFEVLSSVGHIRDLPSSEMGVDIENGFTPKYVVSRKDGKSAVIRELKEAAKRSRHIYLATDPDREGEAIAWHLAEVLGIEKDAPVRVTFNEITKTAVKNGVKNPRTIDCQLFYAQQTRRVLDRIVGYKISPFLWHKVRKGLSAGRVQSVATKLIVDREREIKAFVPTEYWNLEALFEEGKKIYAARYYGKGDEKAVIPDRKTLDAILAELEGAEYRVASVRRQEKQKSPRPPFITSSLQQDASNMLGMRPGVTMSVAQSLYEGVDLKGKGLTGLITYMRTDSLRISEEASAAAASFIKENYGDEYLPATPHVYKTKQSAQDAHEAIRPSDVTILPTDIKDSLTPEQFRLYRLIWSRFMASQMANAVYDTVSVDIKAGQHLFRTSDSQLRFKGFTVLYAPQEEEEKGSKLPRNLEENALLSFSSLQSEQKFTQPPARYTEASLVKTFEEYGIARPSTYASIVSTIQERGYVKKENRMLVPTELGFITNDLMVENFKDIVDVGFTAAMEEQLDDVAEGKRNYEGVLSEFYAPFSEELAKAEENTESLRLKTQPEVSDTPCEKCGAMMVYREGRFGRFLACPNFPECKCTKTVPNFTRGSCPLCGKRLVVRRTRKSRLFYACEAYSECTFVTWDPPTDEICDKCGKTLFRHQNRLLCLDPACGFSAPLNEKAGAEEEKADE